MSRGTGRALRGKMSNLNGFVSARNAVEEKGGMLFEILKEKRSVKIKY